MQACTRGCYKTINTNFQRITLLSCLISASGAVKEGPLSLWFLTHANSTVMAEVPAPGVQFPQPLVNTPQAPQAMNPPVQAANDIAPAPQPVQVNVANAQDELEVNFEFGISFIALVGFSGAFAVLATYYGSDYSLLPKASVFPWAYYVCLPFCFNSALAYQERGFFFLSRGMGLSLALVVDFFQFLFVGGTIVSFCFVTVVEVLTAIMHILVMVSGLT